MISFSKKVLESKLPSVFLLLIGAGILFFFCLKMAGVGFLADDYYLLQRAGESPWFHPLEAHHYSLIINLLFKGASAGIFSPFIFHFLALVFHGANCVLVYRIAQKIFYYEKSKARILAFLFAVNPAGLEAIVWCCAIGYVVCTFWILIGICVFMNYQKEPNQQNTAYRHATLIFIQLCSYLSWDWGIMFTPILFLIALFFPTTYWKRALQPKRYSLLFPLFIFWFSILVIKKFNGAHFGYQVNEPHEFIVNLLVSPFLGLFPQFSKAFYTSPLGVALAIIILATVAWTAWRSRTALFMTVLFFVCQMPPALLGHPQSRYFYLPIFALYFVLLLFLDQVEAFTRIRKFALFCAFALFLVYFEWASFRLELWNEANIQAKTIREKISSLPSTEKPILIINLPDRYGPDGMIWLPYICRSETSFGKMDFEQVYTPDCPNLYQNRDIPLLSREEIESKYENYAIYELTYANPKSYKEYCLVEWQDKTGK